MEINKISKEKRIQTMVLDHIIMSAIFVIFSLPFFIPRFLNSFNVDYENTGDNIFGVIGYFIMLFGLTLYFLKDSFGGRSISKRILKFQVVDNSSGLAAHPMKCLIRNVFIVLWPIEVIVAIINPERRIGDRVAGTKLIVFDPAVKQEKTKLYKVLLAFLIAYCIILLISIPRLRDISISTQVPFIESSYDQIESHETEVFLNDSLAEYLTAEVKVYDKIELTDLKYISIIFQLKADYLKEDISFNLLAGKVTSLIFSKYGKDKFVGKFKYVYDKPGYSQVRIQTFDGR